MFVGNRQLAHIPPNAVTTSEGDAIAPGAHVQNFGGRVDIILLLDTRCSEMNKKIMRMLLFINRISENLTNEL